MLLHVLKGASNKWLFTPAKFTSLHTEKRCRARPYKNYGTGSHIDIRSNINIYDLIKKEKVPLQLKYDGVVRWYMCGPTVYDSAHIGHACCYVKFDIIRRILASFFDLDVILVMGVTDIDDKIIKKANESNSSYKEITQHYEKEFVRDMAALRVLAPTYVTRVTDHVSHIIEFVQRILDNGLAYSTPDGSVYFSTNKFEHYGKLSKQALSVQSESRDPVMPGQKNICDFALWKGARPGEPSWDAPWGSGRPGWHIECSAMASSLFGESLDIHSGGIDLLFPHHENEEAQCCAHHMIPKWTTHWLHTGHLHLKNDEKMSKSLQNTITISDFLQQYSANQFRMFCLLSHYRNNVEYSEHSMDSAVALLKRITCFLSDCDAYVIGAKICKEVDGPAVLQRIEQAKTKLRCSLANDFDTNKGLEAVLDLVAFTNRMLHNQSDRRIEPVREVTAVSSASEFVRHTLCTLGVQLSSALETQGWVEKSPQSSTVLPDNHLVDAAVQFRSTVRNLALASLEGNEKKHLLSACDVLRKQMETSGIKVTDHKTGSSWTYIGDDSSK